MSWFHLQKEDFVSTQDYTADTCAEVALHSGIFCVVLHGFTETARMIHRHRQQHLLRPPVAILFNLSGVECSDGFVHLCTVT